MARHVYTVTDGDLDDLKRAGNSEDAIFEITLSAALGAGMSQPGARARRSVGR